DIAEMLGLDRPGGIILSAIHPLSPFAEDFEVGDVIVSADGVPVNTPQEMMYHMAVAGEGGKLRVRRLRDGRTLGLTVRLIAAPEDPPRDTIVLGNRTVLPGLTVSRINPALTAEMRLPMESEGVVIEDAGPYGSRVGLREGDILIAVAGRQIDRPSDVRAALSQDARRYTVTALRGQRRIYLRF
ncbi:MAG: PDZ domain-containing protein, partial [Pseudomonadota bacterium]